MAKRATWKKSQAEKALRAIAQDVAEFFGGSVPEVYCPEYLNGTEFEWRFETCEVWTKAGRAELNVTVSARFAHLYFRFDDITRAIPFDDCFSRLNRASGKWNAIACPDNYSTTQDSLDVFRANLRRDFRKVAERNPPQEEVAAYRAKEDARNRQWAEWLETCKES